MRVDVVTPTFPPEEGGIATLAHGYVTHSRHDVRLVTDVPDAAEFAGDVTVERVGTLSGLSGLVGLVRFLRRRTDGTDWVHFVHPKNAIAGWLSGCRYSVHAHGTELLPGDGSPKSRIEHRLIRRGIAGSDAAIAVSDWTRSTVTDLGAGSVSVVHPGIPAETVARSPVDPDGQIRARYDIPPESPLLLTVARLGERKGHDLVIRAMASTRDCHYLICGRGKARGNLEALADRLGLADRVHFAGYVNEAEITAYYNSCDVFVMPSKLLDEPGDIEGFGIVFLEANARGKPVIGSNTGGITSAIADGETGLVVEPTVDDVAEAIGTLLADHQLRAQLGRAGIEWARDHSVAEMADRIDDRLDELVSARPYSSDSYSSR